MYEPNLPKINSIYENIEIKTPEINIESLEYENTVLKEMAEDIKESQSKLENKLDIMIEENKKSDKSNSKIAMWTLFIAILTLVATLAGIIIQLI